MRKIIGFKLSLRLKEIQRRAKKAKIDLEQAGLTELKLQELLDGAVKAIKPSVLFETFPHPDADQALLSPIPGLAYSLVLATLGGDYEKLTVTEPLVVWPIVTETALEECVRFASSLISEEAAKDSCELSPITALSEPDAASAAVRKLDGVKIGVAIQDGRLRPAPSTAVSLSWLAKSKAKGKAK